MKRIFVLILALIMILSFVGCGDKPSGEPKAAIEQYYQSQKDGNFEAAYNLLCSENQSQITLDDFKDWNIIVNQLSKTNSFNTNKEEQLESFSFNGKEYKYAFKYTTSFQDENYLTQKEDTYESIKLVVSENKEWKVLSEESFKTKFASTLDNMGWAYREGKSVDKDVNQALGFFLKAIEIDPDYTPTYYDIAYTYYYKGNNDKALEYIVIGINKEEDNISLSDMYNIKGNILKSKGDYQGARESYQKALELNPNNVYATDNLAGVDN